MIVAGKEKGKSQQFLDFMKYERWVNTVLPYYSEAFSSHGHVLYQRVRGELRTLDELQELCKKKDVGTALDDLLVGLSLVVKYKDMWHGKAEGWSRTFTYFTFFVSNHKKPNLRFGYDRPSNLLPGESRPEPEYQYREDFLYGKGICVNLCSGKMTGVFDRALVSVADREFLKVAKIRWDDVKSSRHRFRLEPAQAILQGCQAHLANPEELVMEAERNVGRFLTGVDRMMRRERDER